VTNPMTQGFTAAGMEREYFITETADEIRPIHAQASAHLGQTGPGTPRKTFDARSIFFLGLLLAGSGLVSPPVALVGGIAFGFTVVHPYRKEASSLAKLLLQISVILLGFGMNLQQVIHAGKSGFLYTAISICSAVALGLLLGKLFKVGDKASYLITLGTAICGGSAIAAIAPITDANEEEISVSMGTVFLLNSRAPAIPGDRLVAPPQPESVRPLGGLGNSRYLFGGGSSGEVWPAGTRYRHDRKARACTLDRPGFADDCRVHGESGATRWAARTAGKSESSLVHLSVCRCLGIDHLPATLHGNIPGSQSARQSWTNGNAISDWNFALEKDASGSRHQAFPSGCDPLDSRGHSLTRRYLYGPDLDLTARKVPERHIYRDA